MSLIKNGEIIAYAKKSCNLFILDLTTPRKAIKVSSNTLA